MRVAQSQHLLTEELTDFFASAPTPEQLLAFRPSEGLQQRARELLEKVKDGQLTTEEQEELGQFEQAERLLRLIKAKVHAKKAAQP